jgi:hypothetical protein
MARGQSPAVALAIGTLGYFFMTMIVLTIFNGVLTLELADGAKGWIYQLWNAWLLFGALLGVLDLAMIANFLTGNFAL